MYILFLFQKKALSLWGGGSSLQLVRIEFRPCFVCETLAFWRVVEKNSHHRGSFIFATSFNTCATAVYKQQCSPLWLNWLQPLTECLIKFILLHIRIWIEPSKEVTAGTVRHKLKNRQKVHFLCFQAVFELTLDSLTTIQVEPHQCPSHQSILLTKKTNPLNFREKILRIGRAGK